MSAVDDFFLPSHQANTYTIRLLPRLPGKPFYFSTRTHRINGVSFYCHKTLDKGKWLGHCVGCDQYSGGWVNGGMATAPKHFSGSQDQFEQAIKSIKPVERHYYNVVPRTSAFSGAGIPVYSGPPKIFSIGRVLHELIIKSIVGCPDGMTPPLGDVADPIRGRDLCVNKIVVPAPNGGYPDYRNSFFLEPSPLGTQEEIQEFVNQSHDLTLIRTLKPESEMTAALRSIFGTPPTSRSSKKNNHYRSILEPFEPGW